MSTYIEHLPARPSLCKKYYAHYTRFYTFGKHIMPFRERTSKSTATNVCVASAVAYSGRGEGFRGTDLGNNLDNGRCTRQEMMKSLLVLISYHGE